MPSYILLSYRYLQNSNRSSSSLIGPVGSISLRRHRSPIHFRRLWSPLAAFSNGAAAAMLAQVMATVVFNSRPNHGVAIIPSSVFDLRHIENKDDSDSLNHSLALALAGLV